jgi:hypothetical protein
MNLVPIHLLSAADQVRIKDPPVRVYMRAAGS